MNANKDYKLVKIYCYVREKHGDSLCIVHSLDPSGKELTEVKVNKKGKDQIINIGA